MALPGGTITWLARTAPGVHRVSIRRQHPGGFRVMLASMPAEVTVLKDELHEVLETNRRRHRDAFLAAQGAYRERVIEELDRRLADARAGRRIDLFFSLPVPEDHTGDYDREIRMLDMHTEDKVTISAHLFDQIVMDRWGWSASFNATNSVYTAS